MMEEGMSGGTMWGGHWLWMLVVAVLVVIPAWRICQRTGYPGWLGVLVLIPIVNLLFFYFIAFATWPADKAGQRED